MPKPKVIPHKLTQIDLFEYPLGATKVRFTRKVGEYSSHITWYQLWWGKYNSLLDRLVEKFGEPKTIEMMGGFFNGNQNIPLVGTQKRTWKIKT